LRFDGAAIWRRRLGPVHGGPDRLTDAAIEHGLPERIADAVRAHLEAGADHVCLQPLGSDERADYRALAEVLPEGT
jgi:hypothetical protein